MMEKQKKLIYKKWGLANCFENHIELNKHLKLKKYNSLRKDIILHEQGHDLNKFDLEHEFKINFKTFFILLWFILVHPSCWIDFLPVQYRNKEFIYDKNLIMLYGIAITSIVFYFFI